jgi:hypothetical protein
MRDHDGAVSQLKLEVDRATALRNPAPTQYRGIYIGNDVYRGNSWVPDGFAGVVTTCLQQIASQPIGAQLLQDLSNACVRDPVKKIVIEYGQRSTAAPIPVVTNESRKMVQPVMGAQERYDLNALMSEGALIGAFGDIDEDSGIRDFVPGGGTGAVVTFNHTDRGPPGAPRPVFIALAHELIHAYHYTHGSCYRAASGGIRDGGDTGLMEEEMRTVGLLKFADEMPSENAIRQEHQIEVRKNYTATDSFSQVARSDWGAKPLLNYSMKARRTAMGY